MRILWADLTSQEIERIGHQPVGKGLIGELAFTPVEQPGDRLFLQVFVLRLEPVEEAGNRGGAGFRQAQVDDVELPRRPGQQKRGKQDW